MPSLSAALHDRKQNVKNEMNNTIDEVISSVAKIVEEKVEKEVEKEVEVVDDIFYYEVCGEYENIFYYCIVCTVTMYEPVYQYRLP